MKEKCDICQKKQDANSGENWYTIKYYRGQRGGEVIKNCADCYQANKQEYLQNYQTIYLRFPDQDGGHEWKVIKGNIGDCYAGHKNQNGRILRQENCPHCQPWKKHNKEGSKPTKTCSECGKVISESQEKWTYINHEKKEKIFCSIECLVKSKEQQKPQQNAPPKIPDNNQIPIGLKIFFWIGGTALIMSFIGIMLYKISQKKKEIIVIYDHK